jgi:hypothetical protein
MLKFQAHYSSDDTMPQSDTSDFYTDFFLHNQTDGNQNDWLYSDPSYSEYDVFDSLGPSLIISAGNFSSVNTQEVNITFEY